MKRTLTVEELRKYFIDQHVKGFQWDNVTHHPMSRQEAEQLWEQAGDSIVESLGAGVRRNPSDTFKSIPIGATFNFAHEKNWLDIAKGPWTKVSQTQYVAFGTSSPRHTVGKVTTSVCPIKTNPTNKPMAAKKNRNTDVLTLIGMASSGETMAIYDYVREMNLLETEQALEYINDRISNKKDLSPNAGFVLGQIHYALSTNPSAR